MKIEKVLTLKLLDEGYASSLSGVELARAVVEAHENLAKVVISMEKVKYLSTGFVSGFVTTVINLSPVQDPFGWYYDEKYVILEGDDKLIEVFADVFIEIL